MLVLKTGSQPVTELQTIETVNRILPTMIEEIRDRLDEALSIARAAESCATDGNVDRAMQILMDAEPLYLDAHDLFKAALTLRRHVLHATDD